MEVTTLQSICSDNQRIAGWLFPRVNKDHFSYEPCADFFKRILFLTNKDGEIPRWDDLLEDMAISEEARDDLAEREVNVVESRRQANLVISKLDEYRRARVFFSASRHIAKTLREDKVDLNALSESMGEFLARSRGGTNLEDCFTHIGGKRFDREALREVLEKSEQNYLPTGFRAYDGPSQGVPIGSAFVIAGETGAGKCSLFETPVITSEGIIELGSIWESFQTNIDSDGLKAADRKILVQTHEGNIKRITAAYKTKGKPIRVTFSNGAQVTGLAEHKLWILDMNNVPHFKRLDEINEGDVAPLEDIDAALKKLRNARD